MSITKRQYRSHDPEARYYMFKFLIQENCTGAGEFNRSSYDKWHLAFDDDSEIKKWIDRKLIERSLNSSTESYRFLK